MLEDVIAGHRTVWRVWPQGGARPVLALHCSLAHAGAWSALAARLGGVTVTAPDLPGHGRSADVPPSEDMHALTTRIATAMAEPLRDGGSIDLIGHSFGATVALRLALERPDLVRSLVLVEPVLFAAARVAGFAGYAAFAATQGAAAQRLRQGDPQGATEAFLAVWGGGQPFAALPDAQRRYAVNRIGLVMAQNAVLMEDTAGLLRTGRLEALAVPVLLAEGAQSPAVIGAVMGELARRLPQARRLVVPGAGHMLPITHASAVAAGVRAHLADS